MPLVFLLGSLILFGISLLHGFVWDDVLVVQRNEALRSLTELPRLFVSPYLNAEAGLYRPLTMGTLALNFLVFGESPWSFHLINVLLHALNAWLVCVLVARLSGDRWCAALTGLWFLILPIHTEAIALAVGRAELLAAAFSLLALILFIGQRSASLRSALAAALCFFFALLGKEHAVAVLPIIVSSVLLRARAERRPALQALWAARRSLLWLLCALGLYLDLRLMALGPFTFAGDTTVTIVENPLAFMPPLQRFLTTVKIVSLYAEKSLWPVTLSIDYGYHQIPPATAIWNVRVLIGLALVAVLCWIAVRPLFRVTRKASMSSQQLIWSHAAVLLLWFFLPVSNFIILIGTEMGERLMYLPSIGLCLMLALFTLRLVRRWRWRMPLTPWRNLARAVGLVLVGGLAIFYSWRSYTRMLDWRTGDVLLASAVKASPNSVKMQTECAILDLVNGHVTQAESQLQALAQRCPTYFHAVHGLGLVYYAQHRYDLAAQQFLKALQLNYDIRIYQNLGLVYFDQQQYEQARAVLLLRFDHREGLANAFLQHLFEQQIERAQAEGRDDEVRTLRRTAQEVLAISPSDRLQ